MNQSFRPNTQVAVDLVPAKSIMMMMMMDAPDDGGWTVMSYEL